MMVSYQIKKLISEYRKYSNGQLWALLVWRSGSQRRCVSTSKLKNNSSELEYNTTTWTMGASYATEPTGKGVILQTKVTNHNYQWNTILLLYNQSKEFKVWNPEDFLGSLSVTSMPKRLMENYRNNNPQGRMIEGSDFLGMKFWVTSQSKESQAAKFLVRAGVHSGCY